eukprot:CAMPEP_0171985530 /NCGR_PEP_ID=MMETSP0993-20121228/274398_1 /TAXON_ID=483369 /ORGANISM="non described non described, Strain CCMP2098" /LENGTH=571 /DNA_ID=CAMNT_0012638399 /DNA_START=89 /DNA_END=1805 /DNA_ORIENTATION=+
MFCFDDMNDDCSNGAECMAWGDSGGSSAVDEGVSGQSIPQAQQTVDSCPLPDAKVWQSTPQAVQQTSVGFFPVSYVKESGPYTMSNLLTSNPIGYCAAPTLGAPEPLQSKVLTSNPIGDCAALTHSTGMFCFDDMSDECSNGAECMAWGDSGGSPAVDEGVSEQSIPQAAQQTTVNSCPAPNVKVWRTTPQAVQQTSVGFFPASYVKESGPCTMSNLSTSNTIGDCAAPTLGAPEPLQSKVLTSNTSGECAAPTLGAPEALLSEIPIALPAKADTGRTRVFLLGSEAAGPARASQRDPDCPSCQGRHRAHTCVLAGKRGRRPGTSKSAAAQKKATAIEAPRKKKAKAASSQNWSVAGEERPFLSKPLAFPLSSAYNLPTPPEAAAPAPAAQEYHFPNMFPLLPSHPEAAVPEAPLTLFGPSRKMIEDDACKSALRKGLERESRLPRQHSLTLSSVAMPLTVQKADVENANSARNVDAAAATTTMAAAERQQHIPVGIATTAPLDVMATADRLATRQHNIIVGTTTTTSLDMMATAERQHDIPVGTTTTTSLDIDLMGVMWADTDAAAFFGL